MSLHIEQTAEAKEILRKDKVRTTVSSLIISVLSLAVLGALLALLIIAIPIKTVETIITYEAPLTEETTDTNQPKVEINQQQSPQPPSNSSASANVLTSTSTLNDISVPDSESIASFESLEFGESDDFGLDASFSESFASEVSFFGTTSNGNKICYVIDYSQSMSSLGRDNLMRNELKRSMKDIEAGPDFGLIFFADAAWDAGSLVRPSPQNKSVAVRGINGKTYKWEVSGKSLLTAGAKQKAAWRSPNRSNINTAIDHITNTPLVTPISTVGTQWKQALEAAMNMDPKPNVIIFMTDGNTPNSINIAKEVAKEAKKKDITINTISLIEPEAVEGLKILAKETDGSATLVKEGGKQVIDLFTGKSSEIN